METCSRYRYQLIDLFLHQYCNIGIHFRVWAYLSAKFLMFSLFIMRLVIVYNHPMYHFNLTTLKVASSFVILFAICIGILAGFTQKQNVYDDAVSSLGYCTLRSTAIGVLFALYDIICSIGRI